MYAVRPGSRAPEETVVEVTARTKDGSQAFLVTRFKSDGELVAARWMATGKVDEAFSPLDLVGGSRGRDLRLFAR